MRRQREDCEEGQRCRRRRAGPGDRAAAGRRIIRCCRTVLGRHSHTAVLGAAIARADRRDLERRRARKVPVLRTVPVARVPCCIDRESAASQRSHQVEVQTKLAVDEGRGLGGSAGGGQRRRGGLVDRLNEEEGPSGDAGPSPNPLVLRSALLFAVLFLGIWVATECMQVGAQSISIAAASNNLAKGGYAMAFGERRTGRGGLLLHFPRAALKMGAGTARFCARATKLHAVIAARTSLAVVAPVRVGSRGRWRPIEVRTDTAPGKRRGLTLSDAYRALPRAVSPAMAPGETRPRRRCGEQPALRMVLLGLAFAMLATTAACARGPAEGRVGAAGSATAPSYPEAAAVASATHAIPCRARQLMSI